MEKISGILPSSTRIEKVDLSEAPALRPSTPNFRKASFEFEPASTWKTKDIAKAGLVDEVASDFFANQMTSFESGYPTVEPIPVFAPAEPVELHKPMYPPANPEPPVYGADSQLSSEGSVSGESLDVYA